MNVASPPSTTVGASAVTAAVGASSSVMVTVASPPSPAFTTSDRASAKASSPSARSSSAMVTVMVCWRGSPGSKARRPPRLAKSSGAVAVPATVAKVADTGRPLAADSVTVRSMLPPPSATVPPAKARVGVASSSSIVPVADGLPCALTAPVRSTRKASVSASSRPSSSIATVIVCSVTPAANVSAPSVAV